MFWDLQLYIRSMEKKYFIGLILNIGFITISAQQLFVAIENSIIWKGILSGLGLIIFSILLFTLLAKNTKKAQ